MKKLLFTLVVTLNINCYAEPLYTYEMPSNRSGAYVNLNLGLLNSPNGGNYTFQDNGYNLSSYTDDSLLYNLNAGYQFNRYFALEGGASFSQIAYSGITACDGIPCGMAAPTGNYTAFDIAAKGFVPLLDALTLYGKLGYSINMYGFSTPDLSETIIGNGALLGLGLQLDAFKNWTISIEDNYTFLFAINNNNLNVPIQNPNVIMGGIGYKF